MDLSLVLSTCNFLADSFIGVGAVGAQEDSGAGDLLRNAGNDPRVWRRGKIYISAIHVHS